VRRLIASRWLTSGDEVLIFNTASSLKYLDVVPKTVNDDRR
jgi:hypothetical protein